ncbi:MAG: hypothetical protein ABH879_05650 [archaeon]
MGTKLWAVAIVFFCTVLTSAAQVCYKLGVERLQLTPAGILSNYFILGGIVIYLVSAALLILALKGGELTVLYPVISTGYIWVSLLSVYLFGELMNPWKWAGVGLVIIGVTMIGKGSTNVSIRKTMRGGMRRILGGSILRGGT